MQVVNIHEREARIFPRSDLLSSDGQSLVLPEVRSLGAVELRDVASGVELRARGVVGYLPLTKDIALNIRPKFPLGSLWRMLEVAGDDCKVVLPVLRKYGFEDGGAPPEAMLVRSFCFFLGRILSAGVSRKYVPEAYQGYFRPKVNFSLTLSKHVSRGDQIKAVSDGFNFSSDHSVNGLLKSACVDFLRRIPKGKGWDFERSTLRDALNCLHAVRQIPMLIGADAVVNALPIWVRDSYLKALSVYGILLGHTNIGFSFEAVGCSSPTFLFSLDRVFEEFIRRSLMQRMSEMGVKVLDGNPSKNHFPLFSDCHTYPVKSDLIFRCDAQTVGIGEVKYKPRIEEADRYQLISHVMAHGAPVGLWVSPVLGDQSSLDYVGGLKSGEKFYHYRISISGNLDEAVNLMSTSVAQVILGA